MKKIILILLIGVISFAGCRAKKKCFDCPKWSKVDTGGELKGG